MSEWKKKVELTPDQLEKAAGGRADELADGLVDKLITPKGVSEQRP